MSLPDYEQDVLDRLEKNGNPLGWKPLKRDERGQAVMQTILPGKRGERRVCRMTLTPKGIECHPSFVIRSTDG